MPVSGTSSWVTRLQRWQLLHPVWSDLAQKGHPSYSLVFQPLWCHGMRRGCSVCGLHWHKTLLRMQRTFSYPITAYSTSPKGRSTVFHFVTNNNYLGNSLWWELTLRRLLWLQEAQQDAPNDALCYFSCARLAPKESAWERRKNLVHLPIRKSLDMCAWTGTNTHILPSAFWPCSLHLPRWSSLPV